MWTDKLRDKSNKTQTDTEAITGAALPKDYLQSVFLRLWIITDRLRFVIVLSPSSPSNSK